VWGCVPGKKGAEKEVALPQLGLVLRDELQWVDVVSELVELPQRVVQRPNHDWGGTRPLLRAYSTQALRWLRHGGRDGAY